MANEADRSAEVTGQTLEPSARIRAGVDAALAAQAAPNVLRPLRRFADLGTEQLNGKRVIIRVDFNVPMEGGQVTSNKRIVSSLPTIQHALDNGSSVVLMSHAGRPDGKVVEDLRLDPIAEELSQLLGKEVIKLNDCVGPDVEAAIQALRPGDVMLLENLRFHPEEESRDQATRRDFGNKLAQGCDIAVNDAFGTAHRAHGSNTGITNVPMYAGLLMEKEVNQLDRAMENPPRPATAVIGGSKVSSKMPVLKNLLVKMDILLIGGAMGNAFLEARGLIKFPPPKGIQDANERQKWQGSWDKEVAMAKEVLELAAQSGKTILLPDDDVVVARVDSFKDFNSETEVEIMKVGDVPENALVLDIGPGSAQKFAEAIINSNTVLWNGPMGVAEQRQTKKGTDAIADAMIERAGMQADATLLIGGGDTVAAIKGKQIPENIAISTGGGASLEYLEGNGLPGVDVLREAEAA